jgi:opacity protein-like surface antigen
MSLKYVNQQIWNSSAEAFAVDVGTLFYSDIYGIRLGAAMTNFGTKMQLDGKDLFVLHDVDPTMSGNNDQILAQLKTNAYPLPLMFRVGIAKDFSLGHSDRLTVGMDAQHPNDNAESINVGGEYVFQNIVSLRGGYKSFLTENSEEGLTLGLGLRHQFSQGFTVSLDYAYQDFGILKSTQHFAVSIYF